MRGDGKGREKALSEAAGFSDGDSAVLPEAGSVVIPVTEQPGGR